MFIDKILKLIRHVILTQSGEATHPLPALEVDPARLNGALVSVGVVGVAGGVSCNKIISAYVGICLTV